jgi:hypothetical protein
MAIDINNLPLPSALATALKSGNWQTPVDRSSWRVLFPNESVRHATLYDLNLMTKENAGWRTESNPSYLGQPDNRQSPGDIDPAKSLVIADLGPDKIIAVDYRESLSCPSVVHLVDNPDGSSRWIRIAPDIETFMRALGLDVVAVHNG